MKLRFNLKSKEASLEADVERLVEKGIEKSAGKPKRKTRYQIKQEEKRKNVELKQKQMMQWVLVMVGFIIFILVICVIGSSLGLE